MLLLTNASLSVVVHLHLLVCVIAACYPVFVCSVRQAADANGASTIRRHYSVAVARKLPKHLHTGGKR